jgi:hypothetical protein
MIEARPAQAAASKSFGRDSNNDWILHRNELGDESIERMLEGFPVVVASAVAAPWNQSPQSILERTYTYVRVCDGLRAILLVK